MPVLAIVLSVLALAPFLGCGAAALGGNPEPADRMLSALIAYGALTLGFLGGMQWVLGLLPNPAGLLGGRDRALIGAAALVVAWAALILERLDLAWIALPLLAAAQAGLMCAEYREGLVRVLGLRYAALRWVFAAVACVSLTVVWIARLTGTTIVF